MSSSGRTGTAAPERAASSMTRLMRSLPARGLAPSWIRTTSRPLPRIAPNPFRTESCLSDPPRDDRRDLPETAGEVLAGRDVGEDENDRVDLPVALESLDAPLEEGTAAEEGELLGAAEAPAFAGGDDDGRGSAHRASSLLNRPKIILPTVVWRTEVTVMSIVWPIIRRELSTTTMVPSSR